MSTYKARHCGYLIVNRGIFKMIVNDIRKLRREDRRREIRLIRALTGNQRILVSDRIRDLEELVRA